MCDTGTQAAMVGLSRRSMCMPGGIRRAQGARVPGCLLSYPNHHEILCNHKLPLVVRTHRIGKSVIILVMINKGEFRLHSREHTSRRRTT